MKRYRFLFYTHEVKRKSFFLYTMESVRGCHHNIVQYSLCVCVIKNNLIRYVLWVGFSSSKSKIQTYRENNIIRFISSRVYLKLCSINTHRRFKKKMHFVGGFIYIYEERHLHIRHEHDTRHT